MSTGVREDFATSFYPFHTIVVINFKLEFTSLEKGLIKLIGALAMSAALCTARPYRVPFI